MNALHCLVERCFWKLKLFIGSMFSSSLVCIHFCMFFLFSKNCFLSTSIASWQILDNFLSIEPFRLLFSIDLITILIHWDFCNLAWKLLDSWSIHRDAISLNRFSEKSDFISLILSRQKSFSLPPNTLFSLKTLYPLGFRPYPRSNPLVSVLYPSFFMHFTH